MSLPRMLLSALVLAVCFATLGCVVTQPRTEVLIDIDAEPGVRIDATELITTVRGGLMHSAYTTEYTERRPRPSFPLTLSVAPIDQDIRRVVEVAILARATNGEIIGRYQLRTRYVAGQTTRIAILLTDCCRGVARTCVAGESCVDCACEVLPEELPDAGVMDAGISDDAPMPPDSALPSCRTSVDCPTINCEVGVCTDSRCVYTPTCASGEVCCGNQCAANCDCVGVPSGRECRPASDDCDVAEVCEGTNPACPPDLVDPALTLCRGAVDECDVAESCDGVNKACPGDVFAFGEPCGEGSTSGFCNATGACGACVQNSPCTYSEDQSPCDLGRRDCATGACMRNAPAPATTLCRTSARGGCDLPEYCDGTSVDCPPDRFSPVSTVCRAAGGACGLEERCPGDSAVCPPDARRAAGFVCLEATICQAQSTCDGSSDACRPGAFADATTVCRPAPMAMDGTCDVEERCTGASRDCPGDRFATSEMVCRPATNASCDIAEYCRGDSPTCPPNQTIHGRCIAGGDCGECDDSGLCVTTPCEGRERCCAATLSCPLPDSLPCESGGF